MKASPHIKIWIRFKDNTVYLSDVAENTATLVDEEEYISPGARGVLVLKIDEDFIYRSIEVLQVSGGRVYFLDHGEVSGVY